MKIEKEFNLYNFITTIKDNGKKIISISIIIGLLTFLISMILPKTYSSNVVILPPSSDSITNISASVSELPFAGLLPSSNIETRNIIAILKSRTVIEKIINQYELTRFYDVKHLQSAIHLLREDTEIVVEEEGTVNIVVYVQSNWFSKAENQEYCKELAANIANFYACELDIVNKKFKTERASFQRQFIEKRYKQNIKDLGFAEEKLRDFKETQKMVALPEQTQAAIQTASEIKGRILFNEVNLKVLSETLSSKHPSLHNLQKEIHELQTKLLEMEMGYPGNSASRDLLYPIFADIPQLEVELGRLMREVDIQNTLFIFLTQKYEEAKIQEAKDTPTIQVLDQAVVPIRESSPRKLLLTLLMTFTASVFSTAYAVTKDILIQPE